MADNALELAASVIKEFEGLRPESYKDSAGIATIGYGATRIDGKPVKMGMKIDRDKAEALLRADLLRFYRAVLSLVTVPLTDGMLVALTSFAFNVGVGALKSSTLLRKNRRVADAGRTDPAAAGGTGTFPPGWLPLMIFENPAGRRRAFFQALGCRSAKAVASSSPPLPRFWR